MKGRAGLWATLALAPALAGACRSTGDDAADESRARAQSRDQTQEQTQVVALSPAAARAKVIDGLEGALEDPEVGRAFARGFEGLLAEEPLVEASSRMLARVGADPTLAPAADAFFTKLQDSEAMRAALLDYAGQNPERAPEALAEGFVSYVDARLTRPELATLLRQELEAALARVGGSLGRALLLEAGGLEALAQVLVDRLAEPELSAALNQRLGGDPQRLSKRLADPQRAVAVVLDFAEVLADAPAGHQLIAEIIDDEDGAALVAESLRRLLAEEAVQEGCRALLGLGLAEALDRSALRAALGELLALPAVQDEAAALLGALARQPSTRTRVADYVRRYGQRPQLDAVLLDAYD